ncbi:MAG: pyruvate:ferredoxin (flavodoxin) oxidoreductase, partial [Clostridia bacterium]
MILAVYKNLLKPQPANHFTIGINDDITHTSLKVEELIDVAPRGTTRCKFYGLGSDGTVGANKNSIKIIGDHTDLYAQGYFEYDSKKSGGITISHLRFGPKPIQSSYLIDQAEFVACHNASYLTRYDMLDECKNGGTFLLNCPWTVEELDEHLPAIVKNQIASKHLKFYIIDGLNIAIKNGSAKSTNMVMQAAFFKLANIIPYEKAEEYMKAAVVKTYGKKGEKVVAANNAAIDGAIAGLIEVKVPAEWATTTIGAPIAEVSHNKYYEEFIRPIIEQKGNKLPVSAFNPSGIVPTGTTKFEKRGIAVNIPVWQSDKCIQCNQCSLVCPHAAIRPVLVEDGESVPESFETKTAIGIKGAKFRMQVSPLDCTGCSSCANVCPAKEKALVMTPVEQTNEAENYEFAQKVKQVASPLSISTVKGSQFKQPLFEFSGACAGCGETPYVKLVTQLFGDQMLIANATGCSSIYGGSAPTCPYTVNDEGHGPAWANSLFEDNAEFGYGMNLAVTQRRNHLKEMVSSLAVKWEGWEEGKSACEAWLKGFDNTDESKKASVALIKCLEGCKDCGCEADSLAKAIYGEKDVLVKKSVWIFGGDGWAYDIDYGGVDHVLASGEDVNILVVDTEVYSNTGGQASKSTPVGAVAKFAAAGQRVKKKDLGMM